MTKLNPKFRLFGHQLPVLGCYVYFLNISKLNVRLDRVLIFHSARKNPTFCRSADHIQGITLQKCLYILYRDSIFIEKWPPAGIDQERAPFHLSQPLNIHHPFCRFCQWAVEADDISLGKCPLEDHGLSNLFQLFPAEITIWPSRTTIFKGLPPETSIIFHLLQDRLDDPQALLPEVRIIKVQTEWLHQFIG